MLKLVRRPKSPYWHIRGTTPKDIRIDESTKVTDEKIAQEIFVNRQAEILKEHVWGKLATITFAHAMTDYLEHGDGEARFLQPLLDHFGVTLLRDIDQHAIDLAAKKIFPKASPATRNRQVYTPMSAILRHASRKKWCDTPILARPKVPKREDRWLKPEEAERLIAACGKHLRPIVTFLLYTGARAGECLYLDWAQVDLDKAQVTFLRTKNDEPRSVPLHSRLVQSLASFKHREGPVFHTPKGKPYLPVKGDVDTSAGSKIGTAFQGACRRAGISNFRVHDCRHTWASWMMQAGVSLSDLQKLGGWKTASMVFRYAHANVSSHAASIEKLPGGHLGEPNKQTA